MGLNILEFNGVVLSVVDTLDDLLPVQSSNMLIAAGFAYVHSYRYEYVCAVSI